MEMVLIMHWYLIQVLVLVEPTWTLMTSTSGTLLQKGVTGRSLNGYTLETVTVENLVKCSLLCVANEDCFSFNFEHGTTGMAQCDLVYCNAETNNSALVSQSALTYYGQISEAHVPLCDACVHSPCQNGGTCMVTGPFPANFTCECLPEFSGNECENAVLDEDCGVDPTYTGVKQLMAADRRIFSAYCEQGWSYVLKRVDGSEDFYRTWVEYQQGFGGRNNEHFIGLDNLASMLRGRSYKVRFDLTPWPTNVSTPLTGFAEYSTFDMADESDKYRINITGYSGTAGNAMLVQNGQQFSTYDRDNDVSISNCAVRFKGAGWYNNCHRCNLFGLYANGTLCPKMGQCVSWFTWPAQLAPPNSNNYASFKEASMKIYPI
ncbi:unnamed protein product [Owenia fusiformis]|uniref:Uncharacterized protein n=1 Tax=Owenia fusiformis TaxID=6347 RepID=A0A8J1UKU3_OWEFU|nr:unnamed protein product [Owenia fusiformis]